MMLSGRNLIYILDSSVKMGFTKDKPPSVKERAFNNIKVASIIAGRVHEDNFKLIDRHRTDANAMISALREAHQNRTAGGKFLYLREMMSTRPCENDDLLKYLNQMETLRAVLASICTDGRISIDDLYVSAVIIGLPDTWAHVTQPLEMQSTITPAQVTNAIKREVVKRKAREDVVAPPSASAIAKLAKSSNVSQNPQPSDKGKSKQDRPSRDKCPHCNLFHGTRCWRKETEDLKETAKRLERLHTKKSVKSAAVDESDDSDVEEVPRARVATSSRIRSAKSAEAGNTTYTKYSTSFVLNADSGCTDTMVNDPQALQSIHPVEHCPVRLADDSVVEATRSGIVSLPFGTLPHPGLLVPQLSENLLSIGQLADEGVQSVFTKGGVKFYKGPIRIDGEQVGEGSREGKNTWYVVRPRHVSPLPARNLCSHGTVVYLI